VEYTCAACHETFDSAWTDEEARAEQVANGFDKVPCDITCDDCYKKVMAYRDKLAEDAGLTPKELDAKLMAEDLCIDTGCLHHGTPHVCLASTARLKAPEDADALEQLRADLEAAILEQLRVAPFVTYDDLPFAEPFATLMREAFERTALGAGWAMPDIEVTVGELEPEDRAAGKSRPIYVTVTRP